MKNIRNVIEVVCLACALLSVFDVIAQGEKMTSAYYENLSPVTPRQGSLGSFGNTKINYYTGLPEVTLDLFTLEGREFNLPISLSYDPTGVRTDDLSGPAGMKWELNAGGSITRDLVGLPDEHPQNGYMKFAKETNYYTNLNAADWASKCENNQRDCGPDLYTININGRTIRFVFDQNKVAHTIPRQNIRIIYTLAASSDPNQVRLSKFEITLEDGVKYIFGGTPETIVQRSIEKFTVKTFFDYKRINECPYTPFPPREPQPTESYYCQSGFNPKFVDRPEMTSKIVQPYNTRWFLHSIILPSGETTTFSYSKLTDVKYSLRPSSISSANVLAPLEFFEEKVERCISQFFGICVETTIDTYHYYYPAALRKFGKTDPGSAPSERVDGQGFETFLPTVYIATPGNVTFYHAVVTEGNIRLNSITSATGNRVVFTSSAREDLPNSIKYDQAILYNMTNQIVQSRKLNYQVVESNEENEFMWYSEAMLLKYLATTKQPGPYHATYFKQHVSTDILDPGLARCVFEGVKPYNYKRTFLSSVEDTTDPNLTSSLFEFSYADLEFLRRRTTTYHDRLGYFRIHKSHPESTLISNSRTAVLSNSYAPSKYHNEGSKPLAGRLEKIIYPTGGYTRFTFSTSPDPRLYQIGDFDQDDTVLRQREFEYAGSSNHGMRVYTSYHDFFLESQNAWMKYRIESSAPQNDSYASSFFKGGSTRTIAYDGTKAVNNGWEEFNFSGHGVDTMYNEAPTPIYSIPAETNADGSPLTDIFPFPRVSDRSHRHGLLLSHKVFSKDKPTPVSETRYEYQINPDGYKPVVIRGFKGGTFVWKNKVSTSFWFGREVDGVSRQRYSTYRLSADWIRLSKRSEIIYDNISATDKIERVTEFYYDPKHLQQIESRSYLASDPATKIITHTKFATHNDYTPYKDCLTSHTTCRNYCLAYNNVEACFTNCDNQLRSCENFEGRDERGGIERLRVANDTRTPIEVQSWHEQNNVRTLLSAVIFKYKGFGDYLGVRKTDVWETKQPLTETDYKSSFCAAGGVFSIDPRMKRVHSFNSYDPATLRLLSQTSADGSTENYQWIYNGSYVSQIATNPGFMEHKRIFTYNPLVGLTSTTDPNGVVSSYGFDPHGRLVRAYRENELQTKYFYHKASDTYKEALSASIQVKGSQIVGQKVRFETPVESRSFGNIEYSWTMPPKIMLGTKNFAEYTFTLPGTYRITLKKSHPEFGSASAVSELTIFATRKAVVCVDGPAQIDVPYNTTPIIYGECTSVPGSSTTKLRASFQGICGNESQLKFRWETLNLATGTWTVFSTAGPVVNPPDGFVKKVIGEYKVRCVITDGCSFQATSDVRSLSIF